MMERHISYGVSSPDGRSFGQNWIHLQFWASQKLHLYIGRDASILEVRQSVSHDASPKTRFTSAMTSSECE